MVAALTFRCNFDNLGRRGCYKEPVVAAPTPIALRLGGQDHALEPGRSYLLGGGPDCDLPLPGATEPLARVVVAPDGAELVDLGTAAGMFRNGERVAHTALAVGDVLRLGDAEALVVADLGSALIVPLPALRTAARERRHAAVRIAARQQRLGGASFDEMMAAELRRAPWLLLSLLLHASVLLLFWLLMPDEPGGRARADVSFDLTGSNRLVGESTPDLPEITTEAEPPRADDPAPALPIETPPDPEPAPDARLDPRRDLGALGNPRLSTRSRTTDRGPGGATAGASSGFRTAVRELRRSGLEIVFVFDSTGSMSRTILDTRNTIAQMLSVLRALVPDARIGLVAYRDRGPREQYVVRQVPLGRDFWRATNFVQFVSAEGGGDRPEDVLAGLEAAFGQAWQSSARRVVILAGDAPGHLRDRQQVLRAVRGFAANGRSFVHTLVVGPETAGDDTQRQFAEIAEAGRGACLGLAQHDRVMQQVLTLAFGREFDRDLDAVILSVEAAAERTETWALDLARRGGPDLTEALRKEPVEYSLLNALVRRPRRTVAGQLVELLAQPGTPPHTRHAVAWALQRIFELPEPPIDPATDDQPPARELERLRQRAGRLPD
jgi:hypothetical protein